MIETAAPHTAKDTPSFFGGVPLLAILIHVFDEYPTSPVAH